jgi:rubrerythrin
MTTTKETDTKLIATLKELVELEHDAIAAYRAALERVDEIGDRSQLASFLEDHQRHVDQLGTAMRELGATPPEGGDLKKILTKGMVVIAGLTGDRLVLAAMKLNEDQTNGAYEAALQLPDPPTSVRAILEGCLADERRHRAWIVDRVGDAETLLHMKKTG